MPRKGQSGTVRAWLSEHLISVVRKTGLIFPIRRRAPSWWYSFEIRPVGMRTGRSDGSSGMTKGLGSAGGYRAKFRPLRCFLLHIACSGRLGRELERELGCDGLGGGCAFWCADGGWARVWPAWTRIDRAGHSGPSVSRDAWTDGPSGLRRRG